MIGIYKFTSPSEKIYVGQSIDIEDRKGNYRRLECKGQIKLYNSLVKYGFDTHIFEIIEECEESKLLEREIYWKQYYIDLYGWDKMLFCELYDRGGGPMSEETKLKISKTNKGKKYKLGKKESEYTKLKKSKSLKGRPRPKELMKNLHNHNKGLKRSDEVKLKLSLSKKGIFKQTEEGKRKISEGNKGKRRSEETINRLKNRIGHNLGKKFSKETTNKMSKSAKERGGTNFDKNIYIFYNEKLLKTFTGTRYQFFTQFNLPGNQVGDLIRNKQKSVRNWKLQK